MKNEESEDVSQDPLSPYFEAEARRRAGAEKTHESEHVSRDETDNHPESEGSPLSDEEVRLAISELPSVAERQQVVRAASTLRRMHSAQSKIRTKEDWERAYELAVSDYFDGSFLIESLGGERHLEPSVVFTLQVLRENLIKELEIDSAAEFMLMDMALIAYYNTLRAQRMLGDLATLVDREFFRGESLSVNLNKKDPQIVDDFKVEDMLNRASDKLQLLIDRANQMMIRNLKALQDFKRGSLTIRTDQINIAQNQVNQVVKKSRRRSSHGSSQDSPGDS